MTLTNYLTIPFQHQGRDAKGADCFGLLRLFYQEEFGVSLKDFTENYPKDWHRRGEDFFLSRITEWGFAEVKQLPRFGDVLLFHKSGRIDHCGLVWDSEYFLHMSQDGPAVHSWQQGFWRTNIHGLYRYQEFDE